MWRYPQLSGWTPKWRVSPSVRWNFVTEFQRHTVREALASAEPPERKTPSRRSPWTGRGEAQWPEVACCSNRVSKDTWPLQRSLSATSVR